MGELTAIKRKSYLIPPTLMKDIETQSLIDNEAPAVIPWRQFTLVPSLVNLKYNDLQN